MQPLGLLLVLAGTGLGSVPAGASDRLTASERAANEQLRAGLGVPSELLADAAPGAAAAVGALHAARGDREAAVAALRRAAATRPDCSLRALMAELGAGTACDELPFMPLGGQPVAGPAAALITAARSGQSTDELVAVAAVTAAFAVADGNLRIRPEVEVVTGRFVAGSGMAALAAVAYLDDRLLVAAHPGPTGSPASARAALARFAALWQETAPVLAPLEERYEQAPAARAPAGTAATAATPARAQPDPPPPPPRNPTARRRKDGR